MSDTMTRATHLSSIKNRHKEVEGTARTHAFQAVKHVDRKTQSVVCHSITTSKEKEVCALIVGK